MKYVDSTVTFSEVPDEISLCINISGCKIHCPDCHSKYLWEDVGTELVKEEIDKLIEQNKGISCICFMGGNIKDLEYLFFWVHTRHPLLKIAWYTGESDFPINSIVTYLDYIKIGPYKKEFGGLDNPNTNQRFYQKDKNEKFIDVTYKFWK